MTEIVAVSLHVPLSNNIRIPVPIPLQNNKKVVSPLSPIYYVLNALAAPATTDNRTTILFNIQFFF